MLFLSVAAPDLCTCRAYKGSGQNGEQNNKYFSFLQERMIYCFLGQGIRILRRAKIVLVVVVVLVVVIVAGADREDILQPLPRHLMDCLTTLLEVSFTKLVARSTLR